MHTTSRCRGCCRWRALAADAKARSIAQEPGRMRQAAFGQVPIFAKVRFLSHPACGGRARQGRRAPSHSMPGDRAPGARQARTVHRTVRVRALSPASGSARRSSSTSVGGCPPPLACHRLGIRRSKTDPVAGRGQWAPFPGSRGGASGRRPLAGDMEGKGTRWPRLAWPRHGRARATLKIGNGPNTVVGTRICRCGRWRACARRCASHGRKTRRCADRARCGIIGRHAADRRSGQVLRRHPRLP
jgi:hypothetical protein